MIAVVTDSTCDIPEDMIDRYGIIVVSHIIVWAGEQFRDRIDLQPVDFYLKLQSNPERPTTSQAGVGDFLAAINQAVESGADEAVILTVSSAMSGAYSMAVKAAEKADIPVTVIDSKSPTMSLGWQVLAAARARDAGTDMDGIVAEAAKVRSHLVQFVAMETLEYLQYGGRIGDAVKWVGNILKVKPLVSIDHVSGRVQPAGLSRTHHALVESLYKRFFEQIGTGAKLHIAVLHGNVVEEAQKLVERIKEEFHPVELITNITGPVLGINTGPGALALCGYAEA
jgi:DegV family protein with EDD domain